MSKEVYNEGDLVEAVEGETVLRGRVNNHGEIEVKYLTGFGMGWARFNVQELAQSFTITVIEKAKPPVVLPTEPGAYSDRDGDLWVLDCNNEWLDFSTGNQTHHKPGLSPRNYAPFTRLAPVTEVLDKVHSIFGGPNALLHKDVDAIAAEYGVTK